MRINIPQRSYFQKARKILGSAEIDIFKKKYDFNQIRKLCFNSEKINRLLLSKGILPISISSGTSDKNSFKKYLDEICQGIRKNLFYKEYTVPSGNIMARKSLSLLESLKLTDKNYYNSDDICLTEGSTGGITAFFEYIKKNYPSAEIIIPIPNYYLYKLACQYCGLNYKEIICKEIKKGAVTFLSINKIINSISDKTKVIVITNPTNPTGEIYTKDDLLKLVEIAKKKNIYILCDELFSSLVFNRKEFFSIDQVAFGINAMNNILVIKSYSKNKNLAGFRLGYVFSKNREIISGIAKINEERQCFPSGSNYTGFIILDSLIEMIDYLKVYKREQISKAVKKIKYIFLENSIQLKKSGKEIISIYKSYKKYYGQVLNDYAIAYKVSIENLGDEIELLPVRQAAFNTFVKIKGLDNVNYFDFILSLFLVTGVKAEVGPGFGFDQKTWQERKELGFWLRITYAKSKKDLIDGVKKFIAFKKIYLKNKQKFLSTNLCF